MWRISRSLATALRLAAAVAAVGATGAAGAQQIGGPISYEECLSAAETEPERARERAAQWEAIGGGAPARHCGAMALIALGADIQAATILTEIASEPGLGEADRIGVLIIAGELWLARGEIDLARRTFAAALGLDPSLRAARIGLARVAAEDADWDTSIALLSRAVEAAGGEPDIEALVLRAAARRASGDLDGALRDAIAATDSAPEAPIAWFERGAAEAALGEPDEARESWLLASMMDPGGVVGDMARLGLQRLILGE